MKQPGVKVQSLVPALWNLDRLDQQQLPLDAAYRYGSPTSSGTGEGFGCWMVAMFLGYGCCLAAVQVRGGYRHESVTSCGTGDGWVGVVCYLHDCMHACVGIPWHAQDCTFGTKTCTLWKQHSFGVPEHFLTG
jgi:hypothetical protein